MAERHGPSGGTAASRDLLTDRSGDADGTDGVDPVAAEGVDPDPGAGGEFDTDETSAWPPIRRLGDEGRYHLEEPIAAGGAATVWRAYDVHLGRSVAIKILHPHLVADADTVRRFERESRNAARLHHPNATRIYDSGRINDVVYLVMEYVDGPTLKTLMRAHGAFPDPRQVAAIGEQIAEALAEAHNQGLIHRDIKPANILFNSDGVVKVADFGIAKALSQTTVDLTAEGTTVGSATYIAPEQYAGGEVDARADIYALGIVMYECLTGSPAFSGDTATATAAARLTREVRPPRQVRADIDRRLDDVVVRSTRRDVNDRYDDVASVAHALQSSLRGKPAKELTARLLDETPPDSPHVPTLPDQVDPDAATDPSMPAGGRRSFRVPAAWAFVAGVVVTAVLLVLFTRDDPAPPALATDGALTIAGGSDFDPFGDGSENPDQVPLLWDNNRATSWSSDSYRAPADQPFGDNQPGVGLVFELEGRSRVDELVVLSEEPGLSLDVYVAERLPDEVDRIMGWGSPVQQFPDLAQEATLTLDEAATGRWVLVWLTGLPEIEPSLQRARISEIQVRGVPVPAEADASS
ncbi:protein kinase domain-containing protein [Salsipaludibacter albus]|uniref:protein kinase domain-containing protein n=1 Tax=Salsipaludibacter albus TaxID=2849650 RepID=UPI001EE3F4FE|nr:protein kinase [Salsipaludibacter albus]MBY5161234.1 protein kinase [Salsipaludibacter albus]